MRSSSLIANYFHLDFLQPRKCSLLSSVPPNHPISFQLKVCGCKAVRKYGFPLPSKHRPVRVMAMDEGFWDSSFLDDPGANEEIIEYFVSSSEGEDSDGEVTLQPITDVDLPTKREQFRYDDAITVATHRLTLLGKERKKNRLKYGLLNNMGLIIFLVVLLLLVDWGAWRIVRLPLPPFYLTRPFFLSAILVSCAGYICVPWLRGLKFRSIVDKEGTFRHSSKKKTPPMGGIFLVPAGVVVAEFMVGFSSIEVSGAAAATLAFAAIGFYDDYLSLVKNYRKGISPWMRVLLEVAVGMSFSFWLYATNLSSPYSMYTFL